MRRRVLERQEVPLEVDAHHRVPVVLVQVDQHPVTEESGVVDERVEPAEGVERGGDEGGRALGGGDVAVVGDRLTPGRADLLHDLLGGAGARPGAVEPHSQVVHDDFRTLGGEGQGMGTAESTAGAGDDGDASGTQGGR